MGALAPSATGLWLITLDDAEQVIDPGAPLLVHTWLGPLYRDGAQELIGSIDLDSAVRPPRQNGDRGAEILLEMGTVGAGPQLAAHVDACAVRIRRALDRLPEHRGYTVSHAPADWARYVAAQPTWRAGLLPTLTASAAEERGRSPASVIAGRARVFGAFVV